MSHGRSLPRCPGDDDGQAPQNWVRIKVPSHRLTVHGIVLEAADDGSNAVICQVHGVKRRVPGEHIEGALADTDRFVHVGKSHF
jgi:hypothetical protein